MKRRYIFAAFLLGVILCLLLFALRKPGPAVGPHDDSVSSPIVINEPASADIAHVAELTSTQIVALVQERSKQREIEEENSKDEWRTPIVFYGKVVDEKNAPVPKTTVDFSCNDLSANGTSNYHTTSDAEGLFSISGISGKLLVVNVTKPGYYTSRADDDSFY